MSLGGQQASAALRLAAEPWELDMEAQPVLEP